MMKWHLNVNISHHYCHSNTDCVLATRKNKAFWWPKIAYFILFFFFSHNFTQNMCYFCEIIEESNAWKQKAVAHLRRRLANWAIIELDFVARSNIQSRWYIRPVNQSQLYFRSTGSEKNNIRFWDRLIQNCGCHGNQNFPWTYYKRENVNLVYRSFSLPIISSTNLQKTWMGKNLACLRKLASIDNLP